MTRMVHDPWRIAGNRRCANQSHRVRGQARDRRRDGRRDGGGERQLAQAAFSLAEVVTTVTGTQMKAEIRIPSRRST